MLALRSARTEKIRRANSLYRAGWEHVCRLIMWFCSDRDREMNTTEKVPLSRFVEYPLSDCI